MNTLSLLIYLADVAGNLDKLFFMCSVFSVIVVCCTLFTVLILVGERVSDEDSWAIWRKWMFWSPIVATVFFLLSALTPSQETVYAIAASEMGEELMQTETAGKATQALNAWLDSQIEEQTDAQP